MAASIVIPLAARQPYNVSSNKIAPAPPRMMQVKIALMSDLHLEFEVGAVREAAPIGHPYRTHIGEKILWGPSLDDLKIISPDIVVLAGDIDVGENCVKYAKMVRDYLECSIILVPGNHEFYGHRIDQLRSSLTLSASNESGLYILDNSDVLIGGIKIIGSTLWADYTLLGDQDVAELMEYARSRINDYEFIQTYTGSPFSPNECRALHHASVDFINRTLSRASPESTVVVTHHAPHQNSIPLKMRTRKLSAAYATNLETVISKYQPLYWLHGHVHSPCNYLLGRTNVICNPRGYFPLSLVPGFDACAAVFTV